MVVAFGGDGTVNEAANGLAGSDTPLTCLPGGATNVFHRAIGIPTDVVEATEHLLALADDFRPRRIDLGRINDRYFTFAAGIGLDASVVERVDAHPRLKTRFGQYYYTGSAISTFNRKYLVNPPHVRVTVGDREIEGVTVIAQNSEEYTYFGRRPIRLSPDVALEDGTLGLVVLKRATPLELPTVVWRAFSGRADDDRRAPPDRGASRRTSAADVVATDGGTFPVQVDGDYIGQWESARLTAVRLRCGSSAESATQVRSPSHATIASAIWSGAASGGKAAATAMWSRANVAATSRCRSRRSGVRTSRLKVDPANRRNPTGVPKLGPVGAAIEEEERVERRGGACGGQRDRLLGLGRADPHMVGAGMGDQAGSITRDGQHVVGDQPAPGLHQGTGGRALTRTAGAHDADRAAVQLHRAGVQDLYTRRHGGKREDLRQQVALEMWLAAAFGRAEHAPIAGG